MHQKKKIAVDLDVVTVGIWNKIGSQVEIARKFIKRVEAGDFHVINPFFLVELALQWKYQELREDIKEFYVHYSEKLVSDTEFKEKSKEKNIDTEKVIKLLERHDVKEEDSVLVLFSSIFDLDCLVTFNRKHLRSKREAINKTLKENGLKTIEIVGPEEV